MEFVIISLILLIAVLLFLLIRRQQPQQSAEATQSTIVMQQQVDSLRNDLRSSLQHVTENVNQQMMNISQQLQSQTTNVGSNLKHVTENINQQLSMVTQQIQSQTSNVGSRLDNAARVISDVQKNLGELGQATQEIKELGQSVSKLEEMLRAPKLRGGLGELLLEDLLKQVLPSDHFEMQYRFRGGQAVDAIVRTSDRMVPIDSKFPLENFRKMAATENEADKKTAQKAFVSDVKKHIDAIALKYILPDEGTFPFALMYIPAENIYYEVIIKDEGSNGSGLYGYSIDKKVVPVSPNSFYAYLQVIALGLRGLQIEKSARVILDTLGRLQGDITKVRDTFDVVGTHLENARKKYDEADKRLSNFEDRLSNAAEHALQEHQEPLLP